MIEEKSEHHQEIIIVRRHDPGHDDGHHGGVWKIAFADFMTAMMAFFLVMWLINAANEQTKKAVASYFTPIKLTDKTSNPKGLNDPKYGQPSEESTEEESNSTFTSGGKMDHKVPDPIQVQEQALFSDPYAVLSEIAGGMVAGDAKLGEQAKIDGKKDGLGTAGGEAFHDPFDPSSWNTELGLEGKSAGSDGGPAVVRDGAQDPVQAGKLAKAKQADGAADSSTAGRMPQAKPGESAGEKSASLGPNAASADVRAAAEPAATSEKPAAMDEKPAPAPEEKANVEQDKSAKDAQATKLQANQAVADNIRKDLEKLVKTRTTEGPSFDVVADGSGVLISVGDESKFGMFDIGSAVPRPETVNAMAEIGKLLAETKGQVIVAGHTDARKFSGGSYDNWRLSTDRAHIARYMLIRGGLEESRFERVEGFADSQPKLPDDPLAAANRRIEIRVRLP